MDCNVLGADFTKLVKYGIISLSNENRRVYMKKGFTLAEVLITLGIIGVIAALTAPSLVQNAGSAKIGPTLAKAVNTFESASQNLLLDEGVSKVTATMTGSGTGAQDSYFEKLSNYMKITTVDSTQLNGYSIENGNKDPYGTSAFGGCPPVGSGYLQDGILYLPRYRAGVANNNPPHKQLIGTIVVDINGLTKPNKVGKDVFGFAWYNDGSLKPMGSTGWNINTPDVKSDTVHWSKTCTESSVTNAWGCAGSIFENNLKVIYQ